MLKSLFAFLLLLAAAPSLHACYGYVPLEHFVDRTEYVMHLKVVAIEESDAEPNQDDPDAKSFASDYAVCEVKELLFGIVVTDSNGYVHLTSTSTRNTHYDSQDVSYKVGDEITLIAHDPEFVKGKGMVFPGGGHPNQRTKGGPSRRLRKLIQARMDSAYTLLDKFDKLVPGAQAQAEAAVIEHEDGNRQDYKDLSPEADLLLDLVATNRGAPAEAKSPRKDFDAKTLDRLRILALRAICGVSEVAARAALPLLGGDGHGAEALIAPGDIKLEDALAALQKLDDLGDLGAVLPQLIRHDIEQRALKWSAHLVLKGGHAGKLGEWIWIEYLSNKERAHQLLERTLVPAQGRDFPYDKGEARVLARLIDAEAWALVTVYRLITGHELPEPTGDQPDTKTHKARGKALDTIHEQPAFLAVYTFLRAITGKDGDGINHMRKRIAQQHRYKGDTKVDLDDLSSLEWRVQRDYGNLPHAIELAIRNAE